MITASENDLVDPIVPVPLSDYEDGIVARTNMMNVMLYLESSTNEKIPANIIVNTLMAMLGLIPMEVA